VKGNYSKDVVTFENLILPVGDFNSFMEASEISNDDIDGYDINFYPQHCRIGAQEQQ
jgi:hypothetical protein